MIILDTNVVSELMKAEPDPRVKNWLRAIDDTTLVTTAVTVMEIEYGIGRLPEGRRRRELKARFATLAGALAVLPLDGPAAFRAGQFRIDRETAGFPSQPSDMMIAGIAAVAEASLATRNVKDFEGLPLRVVDPWQGPR